MKFTPIAVVTLLVICAGRTIDQQCKSLTYPEVTEKWKKLVPSSEQKPIDLSKSSKNVQRMFNLTFTFGGNHYLWSRYVGDNYQSASLTCALYGGKLPEIQNEAELTAIRSFVKTNAIRSCVYIGMRRLADGNWYYTRGGTLAYTNFGPISLDYKIESACAVLCEFDNWLMDDCNCAEMCNVMCQVTI